MRQNPIGDHAQVVGFSGKVRRKHKVALLQRVQRLRKVGPWGAQLADVGARQAGHLDLHWFGAIALSWGIARALDDDLSERK